MLSVAVCDDNITECQWLSQKVKEIFEQRNIPCAVEEFSSGGRLIDCPRSFDIVLLDIIMDQTDGISTAEIMRVKGKDFLLIFITASKEYMQDAFDVEAFHYLVKPVVSDRLEQVLMSAYNKLVPAAVRHLIYTKNGYTGKVDLNEVPYIESIGRVVRIHHKEKQIIEYYERFAALENILAGEGFFRCHKSYLVNLDYVAHYNKTDVTLDDETKIPLSKRRYREFASAMLIHLRNAGGI